MDRNKHRYSEGDLTPSLSGQISDESGAYDLTAHTVRLTIVRDPKYRQDILVKDYTDGGAAGTYDFGNWATTDLVCGEDQEVTLQVFVDTGTVIQTVDRWLMDVDKAGA